MVVAEVAVPAAPAIGSAAVFGAFCAVVVVWGMVYASKHTIRPILNAVAWLFDQIKISAFGHTISFGGWVARQIRALEHGIDQKLGEAALALEHTAGSLWHLAAFLAQETGRLTVAMVTTTLHALKILRHAIVPRLIRSYFAPWIHRWQLLRRFAHAAVHTLTHEWHVVSRFAHHLAHTLVRAVTVTLPREIDHLGVRVGDLTKSLRGFRSRLGKLEGRFAAAAFAVLVWAALRRLGLKWLKCSKVNRLGNEVCRLDPTLFESLLIDVAAIAGTMSLVELTRELQGVTEHSARAIQHFWQAD